MTVPRSSTPPRIHKHRYCGVLAPAARLRQAVIASAGPAGTVLQEIESARGSMGLCGEAARRRPASRSWALLLARIHENRPLQCPRCGGPMRIIAFILEREAIERILRHIGEDIEPPAVLPARGPPQGEFEFDQSAGQEEWVEVDQTAGAR